MKLSQFKTLIREEVKKVISEGVISELNEASNELQRSTQYATIQCLRSALDTLTRQYKKNIDSTKSADVISKETDSILAKYGFNKLKNFNQLYTKRLGNDPTKVG